MNSESSGNESVPQTPAAALLFQAPAFVEPTFQPPAAGRGTSDSDSKGAKTPDGDSSGKESQSKDARGRRNQGQSRQRGGKNSAATNASELDDQDSSSLDEKVEGGSEKQNQPRQSQAKKSQAKRTRGRKSQSQDGSGSGDTTNENASSRSDHSEDSSQGADESGETASAKSVNQPGSKTGDQDASSADGSDSQGDDTGAEQNTADGSDQTETGSTRRRRRRTRPSGQSSQQSGEESGDPVDQVQGLKGSTRLEAKRMRRRDGRRESRRRQSITESEFLARRESVDRQMVVRHQDGSDQIAILEDDILVEHFVARRTTQSIVGNIYLGRVQNVLPSMEAAFVDIGRGRNAVLYAGEVNWDLLGTEGKPRRIETALKSGETVMVQVTKDPIGHKGARLTSQITLAGRYLVFVPGSSMLGISRKLPDPERARLKKLLRQIIPENTGVIVRTAAEGATEDQLRDDVERLTRQWDSIQKKVEGSRKAPVLLRGEPELVVRVVRDLFNEDFSKLIVQGKETWTTVSEYVGDLSPELSERLELWTSNEDVFHAKRVQQQLSKAMDRKVWLPSGGTLVIERTEALTVVDVNTGKFVGSGGTLEETVTRNNLEAAEEIVRQLRLRDIGGIIIIDFVDMVLESNRELVLRRLVECLGRDRTRHQVTEITSLGLVQMTRKRVGEGLVEAFSTTCEVCDGRGFIVHEHPVETGKKQGYSSTQSQSRPNSSGGRSDSRDDAPGDSANKDEERSRGRRTRSSSRPEVEDAGHSDAARSDTHVGDEKVRSALNAIAAASLGSQEETTGGSTEAPSVVSNAPKVARRSAGSPVSTAPVKSLINSSSQSGEESATNGAVTTSSVTGSKSKKKRVQRSSSKIEAVTVPDAPNIEASDSGVELVKVLETEPVSPPRSVDEIALPDKHVSETESGSRRRSGIRTPARKMARRAAGSPPSASGEPGSSESTTNAAKEAVKALFEGE